MKAKVQHLWKDYILRLLYYTCLLNARLSTGVVLMVESNSLVTNGGGWLRWTDPNNGHVLYLDICARHGLAITRGWRSMSHSRKFISGFRTMKTVSVEVPRTDEYMKPPCAVKKTSALQDKPLSYSFVSTCIIASVQQQQFDLTCHSRTSLLSALVNVMQIMKWCEETRPACVSHKGRGS